MSTTPAPAGPAGPLAAQAVWAGSGSTFQMYAIGAVVVLALIVCAAALLLFRSVKKKNAGRASYSHPRTGNAILITLAAAFTAAAVALTTVTTNVYASALDSLFQLTRIGSDSVDTTEKDWRGLVEKIGDEGMVLMRNEGATLPLKQSGTTKINLLGYSAYNPTYSGSGSGDVNAADAIDIVTSLTDAGIELNPAIMDAGIYPKQAPTMSKIGWNMVVLENHEVPVDSYTGDVSFESMKAYSDTAVVVIGRTGSEGQDLTAYQGEDGATYIQLSANERDLLEKASQTFSNLIVVLNSANPLEMSFVEEYGVDSVVWSGVPGPYGFSSLGKILTGEVNPSGKLPDTWVYDNDSHVTSENYGEQAASNFDSYYLDYVEGVYVGYKWYETAYAEGAVITNTDTGETFDFGAAYDDIVAYPFGHGLSYTTFTQQIASGIADGDALDPKGRVSVDVTVTNTGTIAGKEVVQLYATTPYTDNDRAAGVEKPAVSLVGFAKTDELEPGASQTVTVEVDVEDLASYDATAANADGTTGAYVLDGGDYVFSIRQDSHTAYDQATLVLSGDFTYTGDDARASDASAVSNRFEDAARGEYLSRADGFANYASAMASVSDTVESSATEENPDMYDETLDDVVDHEYVEGQDYAVEGDMTLEDVAGLDYDDPAWDQLIKQLTVEEMSELVTDAKYTSPALESIGKDYRTADSDGPLGLSSMFNKLITGTAYPCIPLVAATFNTDIASEFGSQMADQWHNVGVTSWYAPAMNIHRNAYSGRNFEYYSEDPFLSGAMASKVVASAVDKDLIVQIKHFALNDQETQRAHVHTYSNEQAIREVYLKPFEMTVKDGGANGVMTSMNYIGDVYAGAHKALLTDVLRGEWGFQGKALTDMAENRNVTTGMHAAIRAGMDAWLLIDDVDFTVRNDADIYYLQRAAHNTLFAFANAELMPVKTLPWRLYVGLASGGLGLLALICAGFVVNRVRKQPTAPVIESGQ